MTTEEHIYLEAMLDTILFSNEEDEPSRFKRNAVAGGTIAASGLVAAGLVTGKIKLPKFKKKPKPPTINVPALYPLPVVNASTKDDLTEFGLHPVIKRGTTKKIGYHPAKGGLPPQRYVKSKKTILERMRASINGRRLANEVGSEYKSSSKFINILTGQRARQADRLAKKTVERANKMREDDFLNPKLTTNSSPYHVDVASRATGKNGEALYDKQAISRDTAIQHNNAITRMEKAKSEARKSAITHGVVVGGAGLAVGTGVGAGIGIGVAKNKEKKKNEVRSKRLKTIRKKQQIEQRVRGEVAVKKIEAPEKVKQMSEKMARRLTELSSAFDQVISLESYSPARDSFEFSRPRNRQGQFSTVDGTPDPSAMAAVYGPNAARRDPFRPPIVKGMAKTAGYAARAF